MHGQMVGVAGPAEEHQLGREVADPLELLQLGQGLFAGQPAEPGPVEPAVGGRVAQCPEVLDLACEQPREPLQPGQPARAGEGMADVAVDVDRLAQLGRHPLLDPGRLHDPDPVPDQRPGRRLVRREEPDRPQPRPARLQPSDDRVPPPDLREPAPVHVQGQDPRHLLPHDPRVGLSEHLPDDHPVRLPQAHPGRRLLPVRHERQVQMPALVRRPVRRRREPLQERRARPQREGPLRHQFEARHRRHPIHLVPHPNGGRAYLRAGTRTGGCPQPPLGCQARTSRAWGRVARSWSAGVGPPGWWAPESRSCQGPGGRSIDRGPAVGTASRHGRRAAGVTTGWRPPPGGRRRG